MKRLHGIQLPQRKHAEARKIETIPLPKLVRIPMLMHLGTPCTPIVTVGEQVCVGQKIGAPADQNAVPIHASVSGTVRAITEFTNVNGSKVPCVEIESDGLQTLYPGCKAPVLETRKQFVQAVRESGCVGLGGAGFPTFRKLNEPQKISMLIVNGAECEPYLTGDSRQIIENSGDILGGIHLVMQFLNIKECKIGIESTRPAALKQLAYAVAAEENITVCPLPPVYPQGAEKVLIYHTSARIVPEDKMPADLGILVMNISTLAFLYQYSRTGIPLVERVVTVDGNAVKKPCNLRVPIGTPQHDLLKYADCNFDKVKKLLSGGPMMGITLYSDELPVLKQQNGLLALTRVSHSEPTACIRCGRCMNACPMRLMPMELSRAYHKKDAEMLRTLRLSLCMNCGCCTYVCPAKRPLAEENQLAKQFLKEVES